MMAKYKIYFKKSVNKDFKTIPRKDVAKILQRIGSLNAEPRPPGCEKLTSHEGYRISHGHYRILYSIQDNEHCIWIVKIAHRKEFIPSGLIDYH